jgi:purine nucleosidase
MNIPQHFHPAARKLASSCLAAALLLLLSVAAALAQSPDVKPGGSNPILFLPNDALPSSGQRPQPTGNNPILFLPVVTGTGANPKPSLQAAYASSAPAIKLLVDADPGVDDAVALNWLLTQRSQPLQLLGVVSVAGNTTVVNATNNALLILKTLGRQDVPVVMGASSPRGGQLTKTSYFINGPDGLWFLGWQNPQDLSNVPNDAAAFYCKTIGANPGMYLLALGPLTNIAQAVQKCPETMKTLGKLVILGGAKYGGNQTPVSEYNFWQDPKSAEIVLGAGLPITLVLLDAFTQPTFVQSDLNALFAQGTPSIQFLAPAIQQYANVQLANTGRAGMPDAVAAVIAFQPNQGTQAPALVEVMAEQGLARGQTLVGLTAGERITMIASDHELSTLAERAFANPPDPNFNFQQELGAILMSTPDNAQAVMSASVTLLIDVVFPDLTAK